MLDPSRREPDRPPRLARAAAVCGASGKLCPAERATQLLEAIIIARSPDVDALMQGTCLKPRGHSAP